MLNEVLQSILQNKLRTFLSGLTIIFAILLFTVLLGISKGLNNAFESLFKGYGDRFMVVKGVKTTMPYKGFSADKKIEFHIEDYNFIKQKFEKETDKISVVVNQNLIVKQGSFHNSYAASGVHPDYRFLEEIKIAKGRFINTKDLQEQNKVVVLGQDIIEDLKLKKPIGKFILIDQTYYKIIGIYWNEGGNSKNRTLYFPYTTLLDFYNKKGVVNYIKLTFNPNLTIPKAVAFGYDLRAALQNKHNIHPDDTRAIELINAAEAKQNIGQFTNIITLLIFIIGFGTLIAGIVGVTNILIFVVKERTKEFGIRKAIGAKPSDITKIVVIESLIITTISGYLGLLIGMFIVAYADGKLDGYFIYNPSVDTKTVVKATIILVISGIIAGYIPAKRASKLKPIKALKDDH